jgi:hypothetical protein
LARCIVGDMDVIETAMLRGVTKYDGEFMNEKYIDEFWKIFDSYSQEERRSFLTFVTGVNSSYLCIYLVFVYRCFLSFCFSCIQFSFSFLGTDRMPVGLKFHLTIQKNGGDTEYAFLSVTVFHHIGFSHLLAVFLLPRLASTSFCSLSMPLLKSCDKK